MKDDNRSLILRKRSHTIDGRERRNEKIIGGERRKHILPLNFMYKLVYSQLHTA